MRIFYKGLCFPFEAYSMICVDNNVFFESVYNANTQRVIVCPTKTKSRELVIAIREAYIDGRKFFSVDAWLRSL